MTYELMAYDILTQLKKNFDDTDITLNHVIYWIQVTVNKIRKVDMVENDRKSGAYRSVFSPVTIKIDQDLKRRKYVDIPTQIMDLRYEGGVEYMTFNLETCCCAGPEFAQVRIWPTTPGKALRLYGDAYEKPKPDHAYFYRVGDKINGVSVNRFYFMGIECIDVTDIEMGLYTALNPSDVCNLTDEVPIAEDLVQKVMLEVLSVGRFMMLVPKDRINDGEDMTQAPQVEVPQIAQPQIEDRTQ